MKKIGKSRLSLDDVVVIIRLQTPPCLLCERVSIVELNREEFAALNSGQKIQDALPERDDSFRELLMTGTHPDCWDKMMGPEQ